MASVLKSTDKRIVFHQDARCTALWSVQLLELSPEGHAGQLRGLGREAEAARGEDEGGACEAAGGHGGSDN